MIKKLILGLSILILLVMNMTFVLSATYWVDDPLNCPPTNEEVFPGQSCSPNNICGDDSGTAQCYDTSLLTPPSTTTNAQVNIDTYSGGYLINCFADNDDEEPKCDNNGDFWCNSDDECSNVNRITLCNESTWASDTNSYNCGSCTTEFTYCDGSYTDSDGCEIEISETSYPNETNAVYNESCGAICESGFLDCDGDLGEEGTGCEIEEGTACTADGDVSGKWIGCNCVPDASFFQTGTKSTYSSNNPLIWGEEKGTGKLMQLINASGHNITIDENACITYPDGTIQCTATTGSSSESAGWNNTSSIMTETYFDVKVGNDTLYINTTNERVGIGGNTPSSLLDIFGAVTIRDLLNLTNNKIINLANGTNPQDAVTKSQLDEINSQLTGNITDNYIPYTGANNNINLGENNITINTNTFHVDSTNNRVGISKTSPNTALDVNGTITANAFIGDGSGLTNISTSDVNMDDISPANTDLNMNNNAITNINWNDSDNPNTDYCEGGTCSGTITINSEGDPIIQGGTGTATGTFSTALGDGTTASGSSGATALGHSTTASGNYGATALGDITKASGNYGATALGRGTTASGRDGATALGDITKASGFSGATALGRLTTASGNYGATALGRDIESSGDSSVAIGLDSTFYNVTQDNTLSIMGGNVGIGTTTPTQDLEISDGSKSITMDPDATEPTINTTNSSNIKITSSGGSVIIQLG